MIDRTMAPAIKDATAFDLHLKPYSLFVLDNGIKVFALDAGVEEVLQIEWVFNAGNSFEPQPSVAAATSSLLKNGTSTKTAFQLNEHFEYFGAYINTNCYNETATITLHCLNKHLNELLPVVNEIITDSVFSNEELAIYKQNSLQRLLVKLKKSDFVAGRLIDVYLYGKTHPYGKYTEPANIEALQAEQLRKFFKQYYVSGECMLLVAGKIPSNGIELINENFGKLPLKPINTYNYNYPLNESAVEKKFRISNDANGVQGSIRIARHFPNRHHEDFSKIQVLNTVLGGFFGSRLMSNIREEKGYTYGIHSYLQNHIQQSAWVITTEAGKDVCEAAIQEVYHEMALLRNKLIGADELKLVRNYMMGVILGDLDGPFHIINRWKNIILNNLNENYFYQSIQTIKTISAKELQTLANKYLQPNDFYELVVV